MASRCFQMFREQPPGPSPAQAKLLLHTLSACQMVMSGSWDRIEWARWGSSGSCKHLHVGL